jgi:hypothetical protein
MRRPRFFRSAFGSWATWGRCACALVASLAATSCGGSPNSRSTAPSPLPQVPDAYGSPIVSGTVWEYGAEKPQPLAGFRVLLITIPPGGPARTVEIVSDQHGSYSAGPFPLDSSLRPYVPLETGFASPCPDAIELLKGHTTLNIDVVSVSTLQTRGVPSSMPTRFPKILGVVSDGADGRHVAGAAVELLFPGEPRYPNDILATTLSDSAGHYLVCVPPPGGNDQMFGIAASHPKYGSTIESTVVSFDTSLNVQLRHR